MNEQETHAEVIAEMRGAKTEFPFVYLMGEPDTPEIVDVRTKEIMEPRKINIRRVTVKELANRLEAAHERERGNFAALREALVEARKVIKAMGGYWATETLPIIDAALAAPPRNCDVGTAEEQEARYNKLCEPLRSCGQCPVYVRAQGVDYCGFVWAQMPYEEGGAK